MRQSSRFVSLIVILIIGGNTALAQFKQLPLSKQSRSAQDFQTQNFTTSAVLPFWDDFSQNSFEKWSANTGASLSNHTGINPPSVGVAVFDGVDQRGNPYQTQTTAVGIADQLESPSFDLSGAAVSDSLYLSFFWQMQGLGERPDANDRFELLFLDQNGNWIQVWQVTGEMNPSMNFQQTFILLTADFLHDDFKFKFQNIARQSGPFDTWLLDYVFLNSGRTRQNVAFEDRTLAYPPNSAFGKYTALPIHQVKGNNLPTANRAEVLFANLNNRFQPIDFGYRIVDEATEQVVIQVNQNTPVSPVPLAFERRILNSAIPDLDQLALNADSLLLRADFYINSGDGFLIESIDPVTQDTTFSTSVDFRVNDTTSTYLRLSNYYAYDDGQADYAAGINQNGGILFQKFVLNRPDVLTHISINFTNPLQENQPIEILVWSALTGSVLDIQEAIISTNVRVGDNTDTFFKYQLNDPVYIEDTIYVGYRQFTDDFIAVGLDKSSNNGDEVYFNVTGTFQQNTEVAGNLMIRPYFDSSLLNQIAPNTGNEDFKINIYPNPTADRLNLEGDFISFELYDSFGKKVRSGTRASEITTLELSGNYKGIYILKVFYQKGVSTHRIIVK
ncbi:T9SS type A sorting domain-containing protein [Penaeicola halotolerans]|uniref:T9SS type A sorting domain-containing protein n=1 Tax=Penaeicola halotolerans TaxID=2793196 RepID=UPI001CF85025|nr:T9SS type A sorting domain-containing protein [Penaeicola halotolerans]